MPDTSRLKAMPPMITLTSITKYITATARLRSRSPNSSEASEKYATVLTL